MKNRRTPPKLLALIIPATLILLIPFSILTYIRCNSYFVDSADGLWRVGAYKSEPFLELWAGRLFYFGNDSISDLKIECKIKNSEVCSYEPESNIETPNVYTKLLAGKEITNIYCFHELNDGDPQFEEITITWVDSEGSLQKCQFHFN
jgi:hypothetical protein